MFRAKIDLKLKCVMATIRRSGRPKSSISTVRPPSSSAIASSPDKGASGLNSVLPKTEAIEATFSAPEAATTRKTANTCGKPQTIWLFMPVTIWPLCSMYQTAPMPIAVTSASTPSKR